MLTSGKRMRPTPALFARKAKSMIFAEFPRKSPTVVLICPSAILTTTVYRGGREVGYEAGARCGGPGGSIGGPPGGAVPVESGYGEPSVGAFWSCGRGVR